MIWLELFMVLYAFLAAVVACSLLLAAVSGIPYVPSRITSVTKVFFKLKLPSHTRMADLGSGDGRVVVLAATRFRWDAFGVEINPFLNLIARIRKLIFHASTASFKTANLLTEPLKSYQVIFIYGFPTMMKKLQPKIIRECPSGTWIVSNVFNFPGLKPVFSVEDIFVYKIKSN